MAARRSVLQVEIKDVKASVCTVANTGTLHLQNCLKHSFKLIVLIRKNV